MLKLNNVTIKFGGLIAVNDVSIEVKEKCIYGLIGPNGAGKTTLFNIISGVYKPTSGEVLFKEKKISGLQPFQINQLGIARTYQNINLFKSMTVLENVMVGRHSKSNSGLISSILGTKSQRIEEKQISEKCKEILDFMNLSDKAEYLSKNLSYGEQRRLEISRALACEPQILLLDEPAAGMNSKEKEDLKDIIRKISDKGITIIIVEHDMKLVMGITDAISVLNYGKQIAFGEPKYIQNHPQVIEAYLGGSSNG